MSEQLDLSIADSLITENVSSQQSLDQGEGEEGDIILTPPTSSQELEVYWDRATVGDLDPYSEDPIYLSIEAMHEHLEIGCTTGRSVHSSDRCEQSMALGKLECTCGKCTVLHHAGGDHLCCRQMFQKERLQ